MKKALLCLVVVAALTFTLTSCGKSGTLGYDFVGTWYLGVPGIDDLVFTSTVFSASGSFGALACYI